MGDLFGPKGEWTPRQTDPWQYHSLCTPTGNDRGAVATSSTAESGTAFGDRNGFSIEMTGLSPDTMYEVTVAES